MALALSSAAALPPPSSSSSRSRRGVARRSRYTRLVVRAASSTASPKKEGEGRASDGTLVPDGHLSLHEALYGDGGAVAEHGSDSNGGARRDGKEALERHVASLFDDTSAPLSLDDAVVAIERAAADAASAGQVRAGAAAICGVYGLYTRTATEAIPSGGDESRYALAFVGFSRNLLPSIKAHQEAFAAFARVSGRGGMTGARCDDDDGDGLFVRLRVWDARAKGMPTKEKLMTEKRAWLGAERADAAPPNALFEAYWAHLGAGEGRGNEDSGEISMRRARALGAMSDEERLVYEAKKAKLQKAMGENGGDGDETLEQRDKRVREKMLRKAVDESDWSAEIDAQTAETRETGGAADANASHAHHASAVQSPFASGPSGTSRAGDAVAAPATMSVASVNEALDAVRPYLIADGGDVEVVSVRDDNGVVVLRLQGACGNCPSSSTTMKMGIERVLKERFGDALTEVLQADESGALVSQDGVSLSLVDAHLDTLRPAIVNYGGEVIILEVSPTRVAISYKGPAPILVGIKAAIKDKFPTVEDVDVRENV